MAIGLLFSTSVVIIISVTSGVTLSRLVSFGYLTFGLAAVASSGRLLVQVIRFRVVAAGLAGDSRMDLRGSGIARMGSEFVALSTPSMIGGEFVRAAWLTGKGVEAGRSLWIGYFEVLMDVYVSSALALVAAGYAYYKGALLIASTIAVVVFFLVIGYTIVFLIPALRGIPIPKKLFNFAAYFIGGRRARYIESIVQEGAKTFSLAARAILRKDALPLILKTLGLTIVQALLSGIALWLVLTSAGLKIDLFSSTFVSYGVITIAAIPVSIGGSGLTEVAVQSYLASVYGFSSWAAVVLWRIASYQFVLAISGIAFLLLLRRAARYASKVIPKNSE